VGQTLGDLALSVGASNEDTSRADTGPELNETFVDSLALSTFDGAAARLTFCVMRMQGPPQFKRYPVCRMVLTPDATVELFNRLNQMMGALQKLGLVKLEPGKPPQPVEPKPQ
jgi:hypothetical protein